MQATIQNKDNEMVKAGIILTSVDILFSEKELLNECRFSKRITGIGVAKCNPEDKYDADFGKALAEVRARINACKNYERWLISRTMKKSWKLNPGPKVKFPNKIGTTPPGLNFRGDLIYGKGTDMYLTRAGIEKLEKLLNKGGDK